MSSLRPQKWAVVKVGGDGCMRVVQSASTYTEARGVARHLHEQPQDASDPVKGYVVVPFHFTVGM